MCLPLCLVFVRPGSPASAQSSHGSESCPKQSSPSAAEASETATAVSRSSIQQLRSSPSMPSLSSCSTGLCDFLRLVTPESVGPIYSPSSPLLVSQDRVGRAPRMARLTARTTPPPCPRRPGPPLQLLTPRRAKAPSLMTCINWWITGPETPSASPSARGVLKLEHRQHWGMT